jgi:hypothetical protein
MIFKKVITNKNMLHIDMKTDLVQAKTNPWYVQRRNMWAALHFS